MEDSTQEPILACQRREGSGPLHAPPPGYPRERELSHWSKDEMMDCYCSPSEHCDPASFPFLIIRTNHIVTRLVDVLRAVRAVPHLYKPHGLPIGWCAVVSFLGTVRVLE